MKLNYYPGTDSLYIDLTSTVSADSVEISEGVGIDYDASGNIDGIDIDNARGKLELKELILSKIPMEIQKLSACDLL